MVVELKTILSSDRLPSLSAVALKVLDIVRKPYPDVKKLIAVIRSDPALAAKIVQVSHSALFAIPRKPTSIEQAVPLLGAVLCSSVVLSFSLISDSSDGAMSQQLRRFWQSSLTQAMAAENLASKAALSSVVPAECFVVGLLQDIGSLALLRILAEPYVAVLEAYDQEREQSLADLERAAFGLSHVEVSAELCRKWGLGGATIAAVALHHTRSENPPPLAKCSAEGAVMRISALAAAIGELFCRKQKCGARVQVNNWAREDFALTGDALGAFLQRTGKRVLETAEMFSCDARGYLTYEDILAEANAQLASLAMKQHLTSQELQHQLEEAKSQAHHDSLTGVYNRRFVAEALRREHHRCVRYHQPMGLVMLDLDGFKKLNDTHGHLFGDAVLRQVASCLTSTMRTSDLVARIGGDEFLLVVGEPQRATFRDALERVEQAISALVVQEGAVAAKVRASIGGAFWQPQEEAHVTVEQLIDAADRAMYCSKRSGGELQVVDIADVSADVPAPV